MSRGPGSDDGYFPLHDVQLDAFESQEHPEQVDGFRVVREPTGAFDGKVYPSTDRGFDYVMGWLYGYRAMRSEMAGQARR